MLRKQQVLRTSPSSGRTMMELQTAGPVMTTDPAIYGWEGTREGPSPDPVVHVIDDDDSFRCSMLRILHASGYAAVGTAAPVHSFWRSEGKPHRDAFCSTSPCPAPVASTCCTD